MMLFLIIFVGNCVIVSAQSTSQSSSNCVYTFHVPRNDISETCPKGTGNEDTEVLKQEISQLKTTIMNMQQQLTTSSATVANMQQQLTTSSATVANMQQQLTTSSATVANMQQQLTLSSATSTNMQQQLTASSQMVELMSATLAQYISTNQDTNHVNGNTTAGVNYIRYGHKSCPDTAKVLYDGFVGKSHYNNAGGGVNHLCLPRQPEWPSGVTGGHQSQSYIFGVEYERHNSPVLPSSLHDNDVPCAVCEVTGRSQKIMIPAKLNCPTGWTEEYKGLLMAGHHTHTKSDFICVDSEMKTVTGGGEDKNGGLVYVVEAVCGSLPCPPYVDGYEIGCVVCTN